MATLLVKASITLAIVGEQPRCCRIWSLAQVNCQGLPPACSQGDWAAISIASNINSTWEYFHKNLLNSFSHTQFIPSYLLLFYPFSPPCCTESCDEVVAVKQLVSSTWKVNLTEGQLFLFSYTLSRLVEELDHKTYPERNIPKRTAGEGGNANSKQRANFTSLQGLAIGVSIIEQAR